MTPAEIEESNQQFLGAFERFARGCPGGVVREFNGVAALYGRVPLFLFNAFGFVSAIDSLDDLRSRADSLTRFARRERHPYFVGSCIERISPDVAPHADTALAEFGLQPIFQWTGMVTAALQPPTRRWPELEFRRVWDAATRIAVNDINSYAYGMEVSPGRETFNHAPLWRDLTGIVGYVDDVPVSTATALVVGSCLYVAMVATHPDYQRQGYAEACMREALRLAGEETGITRTALHATEAGKPVYLRMGYREVSTFQLYAEHL
jgi:GNAT superfamily N-acetyltransferase